MKVRGWVVESRKDGWTVYRRSRLWLWLQRLRWRFWRDVFPTVTQTASKDAEWLVSRTGGKK